ncbi:MAG: PASTA domain-containing protein [Bacteroidota bacterium]|nr:PASTA domain-containing protein [Bacteroidota bacterium]
MKEKNNIIFKKITSNKYVRHIFFAFISVIVFLWILLFSLDYYTRHGETYTVPDFNGLDAEKAEVLASENHVKCLVVDSVFDIRKPKGTIILQDPLPSTLVKHGRTVYLTVVASMPEQINVPNLIDLTQRQAVSLLEMYGLKIGNISYVPDVGRTVLKVLYKNRTLAEGAKVKIGSTIDLVIGKGSDNVSPEENETDNSQTTEKE